MQNNLIAIVLGLLTSVLGSYFYTYLLEIKFPFAYALGLLIVASGAALGLYLLRGKIYLLLFSGVKGYYPRGQPQYIRHAASEIEHAKEVLLVGARGMDLVGENSPIGIALSRSNSIGKIEAFLLDPSGDFSRLRGDHLEVERRKYKAECESVDNFLGVLKLHQDRPVLKYSYNRKPIFRIILTDKSIWLASYQPGVRGKDLPAWHISRSSGNLAQLILGYCDDLRKHATLISYTQPEPIAKPPATT